MSTVTRTRKPRQAKPRTIALPLAPFEGNPGVVRIAVGKETTDYLVQPIPADFGKGFTLAKIGSDEGEVYQVNVNGRQSSCTCKGHLAHNHCKHVDGLAVLVQLGKL